MNASEVFEMWESVWDKCPKLRPFRLRLNGLFWERDGGGLVVKEHAEAIIFATAMLWLANRKPALRPLLDGSPKAGGYYVFLMCKGTNYWAPTALEALNLAVRAELGME